MILENPSTVKLLGVLVEFGQRGATRELLQQKTGMGKTTFYRVLKPLLVRGIICEEGSLYRMPLDNPYNFLFKRLYSMEKIDELSQLDRDRILSVIDHAKAHLQRHLLALWLVGSAAHQTMTKESDLDFLAVLDEETEYLPDLAYDVHFITMTEEEFRTRWREKNDFILTALRHGLLLEDKGFAQEFYLQPLPVQLQGPEFHQDAEELEEQKERFMLSIRARLSDEAVKSLSHYAISIVRRMLRVYNVLPAGKPDLLRASELLFGARFHQRLESVLNDKLEPGQTSLLMERCHYFEDIYQRFSSHLTYLQKFADLVTSSGELNERLVQQALVEISGGKLETYSGTDGLLEWNGQHYLVEVKSLLGPFTEAPLRQLERHLADAQGGTSLQGLLIINSYRDIPLLERRDTFSEESLEQAADLGIKMRSAMELLRALNRSIIEKEESASIAEEFFQAPSQT
jgi:Nucleotidyltransferase domain